MTTIFKYQLQITDEQAINLPLHSEFLCVQIQNDIPCLWVKLKLDPKENEIEKVTILTFGTGHPISEECDYIDTYQTKGLVFHVFKKLKL